MQTNLQSGAWESYKAAEVERNLRNAMLVAAGLLVLVLLLLLLCEAADPLVLSFWRCTRRPSTVWSSLRTTCNRTKNGGEWECAVCADVQMCCVCADDKLFGGKRSCGAFGDKSPFHYEHKFQQKASFSNMIYSIPWFYRLFKRRSDILLVWKNARISDSSKFWAFGFANLGTVEKNMEGVAWKHSKIRLVDTSHKNVETVGAEQVALQPRHHFRMCRRQVGRWWLQG